MGLGPIVNIELVTNARRVRYFVLKVVYAALLWLILWSTLLRLTIFETESLELL